MIAWQMFGNGETPETTGEKGDHFVGEYYVKFNDEYKREVEALVSNAISREDAEKQAPIMERAQQMLLDWENHKPGVIDLWKRMNSWVYKGFDVTYKRIGSDFDKTYYESNTYLLGKKIVDEGLAKGVFIKEEDGSIWIDLTEDGLDKKIVQRRDGTSVYITQDIGLAEKKYEEYKIDKSIYVIGDEQNYHMKVLKLIAEKLDLPNAKNIYHLSYGMVELPSGKMKSREGTVVDADDLVDEMIATAKQHTEELGKVKDFTEEELKQLFEVLGLGAMKFYLLRVDPKKRMIFNPEESIDFHGFTGPFVQYTYARIQSVLKKVGSSQLTVESRKSTDLLPLEKELILTLEQYSQIIEQAATELNPSVIANYIFHLAKTFNSFYTEHSIANAESEEKKQLRLQIATMAANVIKSSMQLLGIQVPERM
jgi:arginyl-tRNA synthetase